MDVNQIYFNSPDWIKVILVIAPFVTAYGIARLALLRNRAATSPPPRPEAAPLPPNLSSAKLADATPVRLERDEIDIDVLEAQLLTLSGDEAAVNRHILRLIEQKEGEQSEREKE